MNSSVILRSPNLAEGGDVRVVRLYEQQEYAKGGLASGRRVREVLMHMTPAEAEQLGKRWGPPRANPDTGAPEYGFKSGSLHPLERRADGGWLTGYAPDEKVQEPAKLTRTPTPLANAADYYTYGERPEHNFYSGNLTPGQPDFPNQPTASAGAPAGQSSGSSGASNLLAGLGAAAGAWGALRGSFGSGNTDASGKTLTNEGAAKRALATESGSLSNGIGFDDAGGLISGAQSLATKEGKFAGTISGASAGNSLAGWPGAIVGGAAGYLSEGGFDDANPFDASGFSGLGMDAAWEDENIARLASNPAASIASKLGVSSDSTFGKILDPGSFFSKHGDEKRNLRAFTEKFPLLDAGDGKVALPDGKIVSKDQLQKLAGAWYGATYHPDGDQEAWEQKFRQAVGELYGYANGGALQSLAAFDTDHAESRHVRGPGTGRSDSIPAQLSDGEYVLTAEDVSLLGDGSNQAGAKRLDQLREELRKHKGMALARGKISPNAKAPLEYLRGSR